MIEVNKKRLLRQQESVKKWIANSYVGIIKAVTGVGKTYIGILAIQYVLNKKETANIIVVVPTLYLQQQWYDVLSKFKINQVKVLVINTASKTDVECDLLIVDEIHTAGAEYWYNIFQCIKYKAFLGLTATLERSDGRHKLILEKAPIVDEITLEEALREGFISSYKIFNLPVELNQQELANFKKVQSSYDYYEHLLGGRFQAWNEANQRLSNTPQLDDGGNEIVYTAQHKKEALMFLRAVNSRKQLLFNANNKLEITKQILKLFSDRKAIIFCESIDFAEKIDEQLNKQSVIYHSKLTTKQKREAIDRFKDNRTSCNVLTSVKALDAGVDISGVNLGICCAGTSKELQSIQRLGRSIRLNENNTIAYFFNLYVKNTQEEKWIKSKCYNLPEVYWIDNLNQIL